MMAKTETSKTTIERMGLFVSLSVGQATAVCCQRPTGA